MIRINGNTNSITVNGTELSESKLVTLDGSTGAQTINGVKTFTSSPLAPTPTAGDNSSKVATTAYVDTKVSGLTLAQVQAAALSF